jgi:hypothetical protein
MHAIVQPGADIPEQEAEQVHNFHLFSQPSCHLLETGAADQKCTPEVALARALLNGVSHRQVLIRNPTVSEITICPISNVVTKANREGPPSLKIRTRDIPVEGGIIGDNSNLVSNPPRPLVSFPWQKLSQIGAIVWKSGADLPEIAD